MIDLPDQAVERPTAVILCGGAGQRLGGLDKPLQAMQGQPLIERVLACVRPQVGTVLIVANRNQQRYSAFGCPVVDDGEFAGCGPLAGIAAGLAQAVTDTVVCVPGDAPLLPDDLAARLLDARTRHAADLAVVHDGQGLQPLCCLLRKSLLPDLQHYLRTGGNTPRQWMANLKVAQADFTHWPRWGWSANDPQEWSAAAQKLPD